MKELLAGLGVALVLEGLVWALFPELGRRMLEQLASLPELQLAFFAWAVVLTGLCLLFMART